MRTRCRVPTRHPSQDQAVQPHATASSGLSTGGDAGTVDGDRWDQRAIIGG